MATFTENYNLIKPSEEDYYDVQDFNENMDTIDEQMKETETETQSINEKIGVSTDTEGETVFGHLNRIEANSQKGNHIVKCVQRIRFSAPAHASVTEVPITPVDLDRTFVIFEPPKNTNVTIGYTLNETTLSVNHTSFAEPGGVKANFQIIEFY